jgi:hypothetical protein
MRWPVDAALRMLVPTCEGAVERPNFSLTSPVHNLESPSAGEKVEDQDDDGENEEEMNPTAQGVTGDKAKYPKDHENDGNSPKHERHLLNEVHGHPVRHAFHAANQSNVQRAR